MPTLGTRRSCDLGVATWGLSSARDTTGSEEGRTSASVCPTQEGRVRHLGLPRHGAGRGMRRSDGRHSDSDWKIVKKVSSAQGHAQFCRDNVNEAHLL